MNIIEWHPMEQCPGTWVGTVGGYPYYRLAEDAGLYRLDSLVFCQSSDWHEHEGCAKHNAESIFKKHLAALSHNLISATNGEFRIVMPKE